LSRQSCFCVLKTLLLFWVCFSFFFLHFLCLSIFYSSKLLYPRLLSFGISLSCSLGSYQAFSPSFCPIKLYAFFLFVISLFYFSLCFMFLCFENVASFLGVFFSLLFPAFSLFFYSSKFFSFSSLL